MNHDLPTADARARLGVVQAWLGALGAALIRLFLRVFGRTVDVADAPWLRGPAGPAEGEIGDRPYALVAEREKLTIDREPERAGLVPDFVMLRLHYKMTLRSEEQAGASAA